VYSRSVNFGQLEFDMSAADSTVTMTLHDTGVMRVWWKPVVLKASELTNGRSTWRDHIDELSLRRHESWQSGGPYYIPKEGD
jgi:alkaline phosphatase D